MKIKRNYAKRLLAQIHEILPARTWDEVTEKLARRRYTATKTTVRKAVKLLREEAQAFGWTILAKKHKGLYYVEHINTQKEKEFMEAWYVEDWKKYQEKDTRTWFPGYTSC